MEQQVTAALITSIVAVVLGGAGLIGGVLGYVLSAAAVQRAGSARQRATAAEEAAFQARAAAEATQRSAEELLARLSAADGPRPATGQVPVAAPGTGPLTLRPVGSAAAAGAVPTATGPGPAMPAPTSGSGLLAAAAGPWRPSARTAVPRVTVDQAPAPQAERVDAGRPAERQPAESFLVPVSIPAAPQGEPEPQPQAEPDPAASTLDADSDARPAAPEPVTFEEQPAAAGTASSGPEVPPEPEPDPDPESVPESEPDQDPVAEVAAAPAAPSATERTAPSDPAPSSPQPDEAAPTEVPTAEEEGQSDRGSRGQVVARPQDAPPMNWAEVLRTGAIPLPSISRGTYAAPRSKPKPPADVPARFELRMSGRQRFEAVNVGGQVALEARVEGAGEDPHLVRPLSARPTSVPPGESLTFSVLRVEGRDVAVQVLWLRDGEPQTQDLRLD